MTNNYKQSNTLYTIIHIINKVTEKKGNPYKQESIEKLIVINKKFDLVLTSWFNTGDLLLLYYC